MTPHITVTSATTQLGLAEAEKKAVAAGAGTEDNPLKVLVEAGQYDTAVMPLKLTAKHRLISAHGATFIGNPDPKLARAIAPWSDAVTCRHNGGEVVRCDVSPFNTPKMNGGPSKQIIEDVVFRDYSASKDGLGAPGVEGDTLRGNARAPHPTKEAPWHTEIRRCEFYEWAGKVITHPIYLEGRYGVGIFEDNLFAGGQDNSALKTTRSLVIARRNKFYGERPMRDGALPTGKMSFSKFIDTVSCSEVIVTGNEFHGAYQGGKYGGTTDMVFLQPRRSLWGTDDPGPADVHYEKHLAPPTAFQPVQVPFSTTQLLGPALVVVTLNGKVAEHSTAAHVKGDDWDVTIAPQDLPGSGHYALGLEYSPAAPVVKRKSYKRVSLTVYRDDTSLLVSSFLRSTPESLSRYVKPDYWLQLGDLLDPENPHSVKAYISGNRFIRYENPGLTTARGKQNAIRMDGSYPINALRQFSSENKVHPAPPEWRERLVGFLCENEFIGWKPGEPYVRTSSMAGVRPGDAKYGIGDGCHWFTEENEPAGPAIITLPDGIPGWFKT